MTYFLRSHAYVVCLAVWITLHHGMVFPGDLAAHPVSENFDHSVKFEIWRVPWRQCVFLRLFRKIAKSDCLQKMLNRIFLPRSWCAESRSLRDRHSSRQIQKLYLALLLPGPVDTREDIPNKIYVHQQ